MIPAAPLRRRADLARAAAALDPDRVRAHATRRGLTSDEAVRQLLESDREAYRARVEARLRREAEWEGRQRGGSP